MLQPEVAKNDKIHTQNLKIKLFEFKPWYPEPFFTTLKILNFFTEQW
jgi:hypothetical protein